MSKVSPTQRGLKLFRDDGWDCAITEHWNPFAHVRQDLFGFIDFLAMKGENLIGVQVTSGAHHAERRKKILALPLARKWLGTGAKIQVLSFSKPKNSRCYVPRYEFINDKDFKDE